MACASCESKSSYIYMWVPRLGTCRTLPEVWRSDTANGSPAERPPPVGQARHPPAMLRGATEPWGSELQLGIHGGALGLGAGNMQVRGL